MNIELSVRNKIIAGFTLTTLMVLIAGIIGMTMIGKINHAATDIIDNKVPIKEESMRATAALKETVSDARAHINSVDKQQSKQEQISQKLEGFSQSIANIKGKIESSDSLQMIEKIEADNSKFTVALTRLLRSHNEKAELMFVFDNAQYNIKGFMYYLNVRQNQWLAQLQESAKFDIPFKGNMDPLQSEFNRWHAGFQTNDAELTEMLADYDKLNGKLFKMAIKVNESSGQKKQSYYQRGESRYVYKINDQIKQIQDYVGPLFDSLERKESQNLQAMEDIAHMTTQSINNLAAKADQMISEASDFAKEIQTTSNTILVITLIIAMVLSLVIGGLLTRNIIMPLRQAVNASKQLADGDLTVRIETKNTDETGQLLESMDHLSKTMHEVISEIASSSEQVATGAMQLAQTTENVNNLVDSQKSDTDQIAAAMTEMVATSNEMTRNTQNAFDAANEANKYATLGNQSVSETIQAINDIAGDVENVSSVINDVNTHSDKIGSVVDVIEGIAEQTNLLALNAAIEAARAGEQGRGFAVVADEVRNLATRTQESTLQIQQMIEQLQSGTKTAVSAMESNRSKAQDYAKQAEKGREALTEIINSVKTILDMNQQIATASEEQSAVCEDLDNNVVTISDSCSQTATHSTEISKQSDELSSMAEMLKTMVQRFTI